MNPLYSPLAAQDTPQIRLLTLLPAKLRTDPICCSLTPVDFANAPQFESLSYCWGKTEQHQSIACNNHTIQVTDNLHSALAHLRLQNKERVLWVDAICINQADLIERSAQVVIMRDIYQRAERVLVWLGPIANHSEVAYSTLRRLKDHWPELLERFSHDRMSAIKLGSYRKMLQRLCGLEGVALDEGVETDERFQLNASEIAALRGVLERAWWKRLWVIQEVCVAQDVLILCGDDAMSWEDMSAGYAVAMGAGGILAHFGSTGWVMCCTSLYRLKTSFSKMRELIRSTIASEEALPPEETFDLLWLTRSTQPFQASDPHDKIYGLMGLMRLRPDEEEVSIVPDYQLSVAECYQHAALTIMLRSGSLRLLEDVTTHSLTQKKLQNLPSWVPDWSFDWTSTWEGSSWGPASPFKAHVAIAQLSIAFTREESAFSACGQRERCAPRIIDGSVLVLEGHVVDTVSVTARVLAGALQNDNENTWRLFGEERTNMSLFESLKRYMNTCLRVGIFTTALLNWEDLAFANAAHGTKAEKETFHEVVSAGNYIQNLDTTIQIYENDWRLLVTWLRRLAFLQVFGRGMGTITLYNLAVGMVAFLAITKSRSKSHLVTIIEGVGGCRLARTKGGRLARIPHTSQAGDSIAVLRGGKFASVIRPNGNRWEVVGPAYVSGIMHGEAWQPSAVTEMEFI